MNILISGGTGFIGRELCRVLRAAGHRPIVLTRSRVRARSSLKASTETIESVTELPEDISIDAIVNLAGEPLAAARWTKSRKRLFIDSRVNTTCMLVDFIASQRIKPSLLISGSAIGYYGACGDEIVTERGSPKDEFSSRLCEQWEEAALGAQNYGVRVCLLRIGFVLGNSGGSFPALMPPFKLGLGARFGAGRQWMSWIHIDDLIGIILHALLHKDVSGPINGTAPEPVTNAEFTRILAGVLNRRVLFSIPVLALRLLLGEMSHMLLTGQRVLPVKAKNTGYTFRFSTLHHALTDLTQSTGLQPNTKETTC